MSFVDETCIRMVNERLLGRSLQDVKGEKVLVSCLVLAFCFSAARHSLRDFSSLMEPTRPAVEAWSPNHWIPREFSLVFSN